MKNLIEKYLNTQTSITLNKMQFSVTIKDIKICYGKILFLVTPVYGTGEAWINLNLK